MAPNIVTGFQYPRSGRNLILTQFYCDPASCIYNLSRGYPRNRLKSQLESGKTYCVKYYINVTNNSTHATDGFAAYLSDNSLDTINYCTLPLTYISPQIQNPVGNFITDTLLWTAFSGTFVANGSEKYLLLGNFKSNPATNTIFINPTFLPSNYTDIYLDDVSVIEIDLPAYAGPDKYMVAGDSFYIGRVSDVEIDESCIWYLMTSPTTSLAIDSIAGLWVKPASTSTYIVRQQIWCSSVKWDTVIVFLDAVGLQDLKWYSDHINLFPNPTSDNLTISVSMTNPDIQGFSLVNNLGQTIREGKLVLIDKSFILQTSDLDPGIYQVKFKTSAGTVTKQFVKN